MYPFTVLDNWTTGPDYWTKLFYFFGQNPVHILYFITLTGSWLLWMIVIMTIFVYCSVLAMHKPNIML